jgi:hypothetical protein
MPYHMRSGRGARKCSGSGAWCIGTGKKSKLSFIQRQLGHPYQLVAWYEEWSDLNLSPNSLDLRFNVIEPPGQTAQKKQVKLLEKPWRAMALRTHLQELIVTAGFGQCRGC